MASARLIAMEAGGGRDKSVRQETWGLRARLQRLQRRRRRRRGGRRTLSDGQACAFLRGLQILLEFIVIHYSIHRHYYDNKAPSASASAWRRWSSRVTAARLITTPAAMQLHAAVCV